MWSDLDRRWRSPSGFAKVDANGCLALGDEGVCALVGDDLEIVGATSVVEVDGRCGPLPEDYCPDLLPHGDVLGVVVPVKEEGVELVVEFVGGGEHE